MMLPSSSLIRPRALDLQKERFDRILDIDQHLPVERRVPRFDIGSRPIGDDTPAFDAAAQPLVLQFRIELGQIDRQQIIGNRVQRYREPRCFGAASGEQRFVIAGDSPGVAARRQR
jgi:hypothetical protein